MLYIITIQYPYDYLTVTLSKATTILTTHTISKFQAIGQLIPTMQSILTDNNLALCDIACIGVNIGPGPFNTLRGIIATVNAISFAAKIPLIGCNGLDLIMHEQQDSNVVALFDAFGNDVYFAFAKNNEQGFDSIDNVITKVKLLDLQNIIFVGNGAQKYKEKLTQTFQTSMHINDSILFASPQLLLNATYQKLVEKKIEQEIFPLYFQAPILR